MIHQKIQLNERLCHYPFGYRFRYKRYSFKWCLGVNILILRYFSVPKKKKDFVERGDFFFFFFSRIRSVNILYTV